jgi:hypothetical protein
VEVVLDVVPGQVGLVHMTHPHLNHAEEGDRKWAFAGGCWREWIPCGPGGDWVPSAPPPATARRFNYKAWVLGHVNEIRAAQGRSPVATR